VESPVGVNDVFELDSLEDPPNPEELASSVEDWNTASQLPLHAGTFDWLRKSNGPEDRAMRRRVACQTMKACHEGGYFVKGKEILLKHVQAAVQGTTILRMRDCAVAARSRCWWALCGKTGGSSSESRWFQHPPGTAPQVAVECAQAGKRVALVNAASAYHLGGGFCSGGRHALEEALCTQSTLFQCLLAAKDKALEEGLQPPSRVAEQSETPAASGSDWQCHIPDDGVVLSPHVEVFRGGTFDGYPFLADPAKLSAVVSVAMPNFNLGVRDAPFEQLSQADYEAVLTRKFSAVLEACRRAEAEVVVMPDVGCGVYRNDPLTVGRIFSSVLLSFFAEDFSEVHLVGQHCFTCAAEPPSDVRRRCARGTKRKPLLAFPTMRMRQGYVEKK